MTWALRRQFFFVAVILAFFLVFGFLIVYPYFNKVPTCGDGAQNGDETGVDCGGACALSCIFEADEISVLWSRAFRVIPGRYNAVAYIENKNEDKAVNKINYRFRFADSDNLYIGKREGQTTIPPAGKFAIFEPAIDLGNSIPVYTTFEFTEEPIWIKIPTEKINQLKISVSDITLAEEDTSPTLSAVIRNNSLFNIPEVGVVVILYDASGNVLSISRTYLDMLSAEESRGVNFTWPEPFSAPVVAKEIIPIYNIFSAKLK